MTTIRWVRFRLKSSDCAMVTGPVKQISNQLSENFKKGSVLVYNRLPVNGHLTSLSESSNGHTDQCKSHHGHKSYDHQPKQNGHYTNGYSKNLKRSSEHDSSSACHSDNSSAPKKHHRSHGHSKKGHHHRSHHNKKNNQQDRFSRTANALKQAGLLELTLQTAQLMQENDQLQKEIDKLQEQTISFSKTLQAQLEDKLKESSKLPTGRTNGYSTNHTKDG
ncbi:predicted protein [Nematostella vectensis]|uniref:Uncharacterized protein n=1 Tax=Nematostella vectensis TaxID=45351 RepID=A7SG11_NEMVE|nr:predicted protein [Nematostella vectensis]|eukprot:XP_001629419.1 predicted protein [Nematostella vectensis]